MKEKKPFVLGDRVRVYGPAWRSSGPKYEHTPVAHDMTGTIQESLQNGILIIKADFNGLTYGVHPKQCTRLIKKPRREWWLGLRIHAVPGANIGFIEAKDVKPEEGFETADGKPWVHVREVKVRK